jgi:predicted alpha/beta-fold hydrolase
MLNAGNYQPPRWLRNPHLQSLLGSSPLRRRRGAQALAATGATNTSHIVDGGNGVRLQGLHSTMPGTTPRALALLLHGWEGSAESSYMQLTAAQLLARGFDVFRLNFRDHGDTHHLNEEVFHSNRIDEVVQAACDVAARFPARPLVVAGYSLGGNFALRLGLRAPAAGLPLLHVAAVCPVLDPARTMAVMESGFALYHRYFQHKWTRSLRRKRELFPQRNVFDDRTLALGMRGLTRWLVEQYTDSENLDGYFDGYAILGDRLSKLTIPASLLTSADDPIIPVDDFRALRLPESATLDIAAYGGHCGFLENLRCDGFGERWVAEHLDAAVTHAGAGHDVAAPAFAASVAPSAPIPG